MRILIRLTLAVVLIAGASAHADAHEANPPDRSGRSGSDTMMGPGMSHGDTTGRNSQGRFMEACPMMQSGRCPMMQDQGGNQGHGMMGRGMMGGMMGGPSRPNDQWRQPDAAPQR